MIYNPEEYFKLVVYWTLNEGDSLSQSSSSITYSISIQRSVISNNSI